MPRKRVAFRLPNSEDITWFRQQLLCWFRVNGRPFPWRNKSSSNYERIVAEILLQRTRAQTVAAFFPKFIERFPSWAELANASESDLKVYLQPLGLWRRRATSLKRLATEMAEREGQFPATRQEIEKLSGVGQYVANAIQLFCHFDAQPLLDVNMARVLERYFGPRKLADIRDDPYLQALAKVVVKGNEAVSINWAIIDHASLVCKVVSPQCPTCPLVKNCRFAKQFFQKELDKTI